MSTAIALPVGDAFVEAVSQRISRLCPSSGSRFGVAFSGGADSLALLVAMVAAGFPVVALHCNFHLRGPESDGDTRFCRDICARLGIDIHVADFDTPTLRSGGESIEMACRRLRYDWFAQMAAELQLSAIAIAHHCEDTAETVMLNLFRGTGIEGLRGITADRGIFIRPMLGASRAEIEAFLQRCNLAFRTDSTNADDRFRRNAIRNRLLPLAEQLIPGALRGILSTAGSVAASSALLADLLRYIAPSLMRDGAIDMTLLTAIPADSAQLLFHLLRVAMPPGVNISVAADIVKSARQSGLSFRLLDGRHLHLDFGMLSLETPTEQIDIPIDLTDPASLPQWLSVATISYDQFLREPKTANRLFIASEALAGATFRIRSPRTADRIQPYGMTGSRLISDILAERKLTAEQRRQALLLTRNDQILWLLGLRASRHFPILPSTPAITMLTLHP